MHDNTGRVSGDQDGVCGFTVSSLYRTMSGNRGPEKARQMVPSLIFHDAG